MDEINPVVGSRYDDIAILVVSCDSYQDLWDPFFLCFFKYWPDCPYPVFLGANTASYPDDRVQTILIGPDIDYSSNLLKMLHNIQEEWVILWIEDRILSAPVETTRLSNLIQSAQRRGAGYLKLIANHPFAWTEDKTEQIGEIPQGDRYRVSITVALWQKPVLLQLLCPGETAWELERMGSERSNNLDAKFFCLTPWVRSTPFISDTHLIVKGRLLRDVKPFLEHEMLLDYLRHRKLARLRTMLYGKLYLLALDICSSIKWKRQNLHHRK